MKFTKMMALGNDFILINCFEEETNFEPNRLAQLMCERRFGVGADGIIFLEPSKNADFKISTYNGEGKQILLDGNAVRLLAKYVYDTRLTNMTTINIETPVGIREVILTVKDEKAKLATITIDTPILHSNAQEVSLDAGAKLTKEEIVETLAIGENSMKMVVVDVGEEHAVIFAKDLDSMPCEKIGPLIENHKRFPKKTNVIFTEKIDDTHVKARIWSRDMGEIMSSTSSAAAAAVASKLLGFVEANVDVKYPGGSVQVSIEENGSVKVTGAVAEIFVGDFVL